MYALLLPLLIYWILCSLGGGYLVALDPGTQKMRERAEKGRPRMHRMVTCHPCAVGWCGLVCACVWLSAFTAFGLTGLLYACVFSAPAGGLGIGALCGMLGGS